MFSCARWSLWFLRLWLHCSAPGRSDWRRENKSLYQYINDICEKGPETEILHFLFTGESEYIQFAGKYNISLYDEFSQKLENKLIDEFYSLNQKQFCDDLENFTDYFLSEHTILLKTYIYDILDSFTAKKLKCIIFK